MNVRHAWNFKMIVRRTTINHMTVCSTALKMSWKHLGRSTAQSKWTFLYPPSIFESKQLRCGHPANRYQCYSSSTLSALTVMGWTIYSTALWRVTVCCTLSAHKLIECTYWQNAVCADHCVVASIVNWPCVESGHHAHVLTSPRHVLVHIGPRRVHCCIEQMSETFYNLFQGSLTFTQCFLCKKMHSPHSSCFWLLELVNKTA